MPVVVCPASAGQTVADRTLVRCADLIGGDVVGSLSTAIVANPDRRGAADSVANVPGAMILVGPGGLIGWAVCRPCGHDLSGRKSS